MTHQSNGSAESLSHTSSCQLVSPQRPCGSQSALVAKKSLCTTAMHSGEIDILTLALLFIKVPGATGCHTESRNITVYLVVTFSGLLTICSQRESN